MCQDMEVWGAKETKLVQFCLRMEFEWETSKRKGVRVQSTKGLETHEKLPAKWQIAKP